MDGEDEGKGKGDDEAAGAEDHDAKVEAQGRKRGGKDDGGKKGKGGGASGKDRADDVDMAPEITLTVRGKKRTLDIDDPELPAWVSDHQFGAGDYPYDKRLKRKTYEAEMQGLQAELVKMQGWVQDAGARVVALFEGRDAAGKGGTIRTVRENLNPRHARIVALTAPDGTERGQWYYQRYVEHLPTAGEMVLFDRSWYNRGVVEPVMGYCTMPESRHFLEHAPGFERQLTADGIHLLKFWLNIGRETQIKRFHDRRHDPLKLWKLSPNDVKSLARWDDYTAARDRTIGATSIPEAPWIVVRANDKRRARLNLIRALLMRIPYEGRDEAAIGEPDPRIVGEGLDVLERSGE